MKLVENSNKQFEFDLNLDHDEEMAKVENAKLEQAIAYAQINGFNTDIFMDGIIKSATPEEMQLWLSNPDRYREKIENFTIYQYISNPSVFQMFDTSFSLPTLNYKFNKDIEEDMTKEQVLGNTKLCKKALKHVKHQLLTRQLMTQLATAGTVCALWTGTKKKPVLYVFDDLNYIFPAYQKGNDWVIWMDLAWFDTMTERERQITINSLKPVVTMDDYNSYKDAPTEYRYLEFPLNKSVYLSTHRLYANQRFGLPWATQTALDTLHKERLKMLEKSIANKVINSVAILQLGESDAKSSLYHDQRIRKDKKKVVNGVKAGLKANEKGETPVIAIPHWSKLEFINIDTDGLDSKKFETTNNDINVASNGMDSLYSGQSTFSTGKLTLSLTYSKVAVLLEQIEIEAYQKLFNYILPARYRDFISLDYDKEMPMTKDQKIKILKELASTHGFSMKAVIDMIDGIDWDDYLAQTIFEQEVLELPTKVIPYGNAFTSDGNQDQGGGQEKEEVTDSGAKSRDT